MSFTEKQIAELGKPLNRAHVKPPAPGKYGDYIEGWRTIDEANRIFGFDGWSRETIILAERHRELVTLTEKNGPYQQWRVAYEAKVRVVAGGIAREGTGFGHGQGKPEALGDAIESAAKEAETDAMKRALMTFGNPFGLALYDKTQANVADLLPDEVEAMLAAIRACDTVDQLMHWQRANGRAANATGYGAMLAGEWETRKAALDAVGALRAG